MDRKIALTNARYSIKVERCKQYVHEKNEAMIGSENEKGFTG